MFDATSQSAITSLESQAKSEGKLTLYSVLAGAVNSKLIAAFNKEYPYIKVTLLRNTASALDTTISQQAKAGQSQWDVADLTGTDYLVMKQLGVITPYFVPPMAKEPASYRFSAGNNLYWGGVDNLQVTGFSWNSQRLPQSAVPKTLEDLANPDLRGLMGTVSSDTGSNFVGTVLHYLGQQKGMALIQSMSHQKINVQAISAAAEEGLVASGVVAASPAIYHDHYEQYKAKGTPVKWEGLGSIALVGVPMIDKKAPDPAAAMLWVDFELSQAGQQVMLANGYFSATSLPNFPTWNIVATPGLTAAKYEQEDKQWKALFQKYFQGQ